ncbi:aldo/keto reductase [Micromonospora sp.]|uniref:aldo/keto reductase n=1 Tax=Micromonospora sp. TaxID=1876 RepID=UPI003B3B3077
MPAYQGDVRRSRSYSLARLGVDHVDIHRPARLDRSVPIEDTTGAIKDMIDAGYVRFVGLSEVDAQTVRRAHAAHPVVDLQIEYSLLSRAVEAEVLPALRESGIGLIAHGVLGRGLLSGNWVPGRADDPRNHAPASPPRTRRTTNLAPVEGLRRVADGKGWNRRPVISKRSRRPCRRARRAVTATRGVHGRTSASATDALTGNRDRVGRGNPDAGDDRGPQSERGRAGERLTEEPGAHRAMA